ncbi:unnamed protein product [Phyllotreta striolata]|uniref:Transformer n=1 Tax=Phyllotreta striolata TaxID=444603 RepID=A0A9N9TU76_PHYSR|nr:unnamed protein product [Phyllotreta striolata]
MSSDSKRASGLFGNHSSNDFKAVKVKIKRANMDNPLDLILPNHIERDIVDPRDIVPLVNSNRGFNKGESIFDRSDIIVNQTFDEPPNTINPAKQPQPGNTTSRSSERILRRSSDRSRSRSHHRHSPRHGTSYRSRSPHRREPSPRRRRSDSARRSRSRGRRRSRSRSRRRSKERRRSRSSLDRERSRSRHSDRSGYYKRYSPTTSRIEHRYGSRERRYRSRSPDPYERPSTSKGSPKRQRFIVKRLRSVSKERRFVRKELYRPLQPGEYIPNHPDLKKKSAELVERRSAKTTRGRSRSRSRSRHRSHSPECPHNSRYAGPRPTYEEMYWAPPLRPGFPMPHFYQPAFYPRMPPGPMVYPPRYPIINPFRSKYPVYNSGAIRPKVAEESGSTVEADKTVVTTEAAKPAEKDSSENQTATSVNKS